MKTDLYHDIQWLSLLPWLVPESSMTPTGLTSKLCKLPLELVMHRQRKSWKMQNRDFNSTKKSLSDYEVTSVLK
jgi:hypothetical protein